MTLNQLGQVSVVTYSTNDDGSGMRGTDSHTYGHQSEDEGLALSPGLVLVRHRN